MFIATLKKSRLWKYPHPEGSGPYAKVDFL